MDSLLSVAESDMAAASATATSTFQLQSGLCIRSPQARRATKLVKPLQDEIRRILANHGLSTDRVVPHYEHIRTGPRGYLRRIVLTMICFVDGTVDQIERASADLKLALLHLPEGRTFQNVFVQGEEHHPQM